MTTGYSRNGFSLLEFLMFMVIVSVGITGLLSVVNSTVKSSASPVTQQQLSLFMRAFQNELNFLAYDADGYDGTDRRYFDDIWDYDEYSQRGLSFKSGHAIRALTDYNLRCEVERYQPFSDTALVQCRIWKGQEITAFRSLHVKQP